MNFIDRMSNGWKIFLDSFAVLKENRQLILFPILSGLSMILVVSSFVLIMLGAADWDWEGVRDQGTVANYALVFVYYLVNYFIITFFNTALVHCTHLYYSGQKPTLGDGIRFSMSRIGVILSWALFAATVGTILRAISDRLGWLGKLIIGLIGLAWNIATFFVVPVIAYENLGPVGAFKRSTQLMKEKWGESLGATFSFGFIYLVAWIGLGLLAAVIGMVIHPIAGIFVFLVGVLSTMAVMSAARMIFISAVYHNIQGNPVKHFNQELADNLFINK
ncbi:MAG: DUF6159 family protein [Bacteroidota bacterium]|nr:DUF6159 family protein [Bacteroidota bacterium]MDP4214902.1 DUF6159 family protein [Bacteroidota bacterium]MDP4246704.1 DUF6159 family protein [Bacteroidota bacterium]MDP4254362.1 DUF6159 family protein [Bacteroidota bacterium]MDP4258829.1 DUF6159 family protein [Bacteroidota bacterium]